MSSILCVGCVECGVRIERAPRGSPKQRCDDCNKQRLAAQKATYDSKARRLVLLTLNWAVKRGLLDESPTLPVALTLSRAEHFQEVYEQGRERRKYLTLWLEIVRICLLQERCGAWGDFAISFVDLVTEDGWQRFTRHYPELRDSAAEYRPSKVLLAAK